MKTSIHMTPLVAVWAVKFYADIISGRDLEPYVDDIMNELKYILGDMSTTHYGQLRAQNGCKDPWKVDYVEIGTMI